MKKKKNKAPREPQQVRPAQMDPLARFSSSAEKEKTVSRPEPSEKKKSVFARKEKPQAVSPQEEKPVKSKKRHEPAERRGQTAADVYGRFASGTTTEPVERKKKKVRRRPRIPFGPLITLLGGVIVIVAVVVALTMFFKIKTITVTGETRYAHADIIAASGIKEGESLIFLGKRSAAQAISDAFPYIDTIDISRSLTGKIEIAVTPCVAMVAFCDEYDWYLADARGKILEITNLEGTAGLLRVERAPILQTTPGKQVEFSDEDKKKPYFTLLNTLINSDILLDTEYIDLEHVFDIHFFYKGRFDVNLGTVEQIDQKIRFLLEVSQELSENERGEVDVSQVDTARFLPAND